MRALILSGGGARGAYEAGVVKSLLRRESFDIVCGTSIGAINGAFVAQDRLPELETLWHTIAAQGVIQYLPGVASLIDVYRDFEATRSDHWLKRVVDWIDLIKDAFGIFPLSHFLGLRGVLNSDPVTNMLTGKLDVDQLRRSLVVTATNLSRGTSDAFFAFVNANEAAVEGFQTKVSANRYPLTNENFMLAVRASAAIPGAFQPIALNPDGPEEQQFVDGGVANNTPIGLAIDAGADDITLIFMDPDVAKPRAQDTRNLADIAYASYDVMQQKILEDDLKIATAVNHAIQGGRMQDKRPVVLHVYRPQEPLGLSVLGFNDQPTLDAAFARGEQDGSQVR